MCSSDLPAERTAVGAGTPRPHVGGRDQLFTCWVKAHCNDRGASLVEYALLLALIAVVCIVAVTALGQTTSNKFSTVGASLAN